MNGLKAKTKTFLGWRMVALAFLCVNVGIGLSFGAYGFFLPSIIAEFSASRSLAVGGLSLLTANMGLLAPVTSYALRRWSIRATFFAGFTLMSAGWALISISANAWHFVLAFGLLCGAATACLTMVPPMALINNWFIAERGRAAGITMVAALSLVIPTLLAAGVTAYGWRATAFTISLVVLLLSPLTLLVIDHPEAVGQKPLGAGTVETIDNEQKKSLSYTERKSLMHEPMFWLLIVCAGLYRAACVVLGAHIVPFVTELGMNLQSVAMLATIMGGTGLFGGLAGGIFADKIGGARTFTVISFLQLVTWPCLLLSNSFISLAVCVAIINLCANAMFPVVTTVMANVFGRTRFASAIGLFSILTTPFGIALPLLAGTLYDLSGSYRLVFLIQAGIFGIVGTAFCFIHRVEVKRAIITVPAIAISS